MAFEDGKVELTCDECGTLHTATWYRMPFREHIVLRCLAGPHDLLRRKTTRGYENLQRVT